MHKMTLMKKVGESRAFCEQVLYFFQVASVNMKKWGQFILVSGKNQVECCEKSRTMTIVLFLVVLFII